MMALKKIREQEHNCRVPPIQARPVEINVCVLIIVSFLITVCYWWLLFIYRRLPRVAAVRQLTGHSVPGVSVNSMSHQKTPSWSSIPVSTSVKQSPVASPSLKTKKQGNVFSPPSRDIQSKQSGSSVGLTLPDISNGQNSVDGNSGSDDQFQKSSLDRKQSAVVRFSDFDATTNRKADEIKDASKQSEGKRKARRPRGEPVVLNNLAATLERQVNVYERQSGCWTDNRQTNFQATNVQI